MMRYLTEDPKHKELSALEQTSLSFCDLHGELARTPAGKIEYCTGPVIYVDGNGHEFDRDTYINTHKIDPEIVWTEIKRRRMLAGKKF